MLNLCPYPVAIGQNVTNHPPQAGCSRSVGPPHQCHEHLSGITLRLSKVHNIDHSLHHHMPSEQAGFSRKPCGGFNISFRFLCTLETNVLVEPKIEHYPGKNRETYPVIIKECDKTIVPGPLLQKVLLIYKQAAGHCQPQVVGAANLGLTSDQQ